MEFPAYTYIAAALAAGLAAYLFAYRRRMNNSAPARDSVFARLGVNVRIRDLFRLAIMIEEKGRGVYIALEAKAVRPEVKKLCSWLAEQEDDHRRFFEEQVNRWRPLPTHLTDWPKLLAEARKEGFFSDPPPPEATEGELAAYALREEIKSAEFYALFEQAFPEAWRQDRLDRLVTEERSHADKIRGAYPNLP